MKWSTLALGIMILGVLGVAALLLFQHLTTTNENDYYLLKESTRAAMLEAVDKELYEETGELIIDKKTFVEMFIRRYAESNTTIGDKTVITFYDLMSEPPKVTVLIDTGIKDKVTTETVEANVENYLSAILEVKAYGKETGSFTKEYSYISPDEGNNKIELNIPEELKSIHNDKYVYYDTIKISEIKVLTDNLNPENILREVAAQNIYYSKGNIISIDSNLNIGNITQTSSGSITECENSESTNCLEISNVGKNELIYYQITWSYEYASS